MKAQYLLMTMFFGVILSVHLAMNGVVGTALNNARVGNALFWCVGAATALVIGFSGWHAGALDNLKNVNPLMLTAGAMGASLVFGIAWTGPQIGWGTFTVVLVSGQVLTGLVLAQMGWLGAPHTMTATQMVGAGVVLVGVYLVNK